MGMGSTLLLVLNTDHMYMCMCTSMSNESRVNATMAGVGRRTRCPGRACARGSSSTRSAQCHSDCSHVRTPSRLLGDFAKLQTRLSCAVTCTTNSTGARARARARGVPVAGRRSDADACGLDVGHSSPHDQLVDVHVHVAACSCARPAAGASELLQDHRVARCVFHESRRLHLLAAILRVILCVCVLHCGPIAPASAEPHYAYVAVANQSSLCPSGFFCPPPWFNASVLCPPGFFCPAAASAPAPCRYAGGYCGPGARDDDSPSVGVGCAVPCKSTRCCHVLTHVCARGAVMCSPPRGPPFSSPVFSS